MNDTIWLDSRAQVELLIMMSHMMGRTLVLPDHLCTSIDHLRGPLSVNDFHDYGAMASWVPVISMAKYLDARGVAADDPARTDGGVLRNYLTDPKRHTVRTTHSNGPKLGTTPVVSVHRSP